MNFEKVMTIIIVFYGLCLILLYFMNPDFLVELVGATILCLAMGIVVWSCIGEQK